MLIRHPDSARGNDLYETPEVATLALLRAERLPRDEPQISPSRAACSSIRRKQRSCAMECRRV